MNELISRKISSLLVSASILLSLNACSNTDELQSNNESQVTHDIDETRDSESVDLSIDPLSQDFLNTEWIKWIDRNNTSDKSWILYSNDNSDNPDEMAIWNLLPGVAGGAAHLIQLGISDNYFYHWMMPEETYPRAFISAKETEVTWGILPFSFARHYISYIKDSDGNRKDFEVSDASNIYSPWIDNKNHSESWYTIVIDEKNRVKINFATNYTSEFRWVLLTDRDMDPDYNDSFADVKDLYLETTILLIQFPWSDNQALVDEAPIYNEALNHPTNSVPIIKI